MLDFRMDTFLTVCRCMNFTRAAEELNITQPAVSQHIHFLEAEYGVKLFSIEGKRIRLTKAGEVFQNAALTMKHDTIHLREKLAEADKNKRELVFGATLTVAEFILPERLAAYLHKGREKRVCMVAANTMELLRKLDAGEIDFAMVEGYFGRQDYDSLLCSEEKYIAVTDRNGEEQVSDLKELLQKRLIVREAGSGTREILEKYLAERNLTVWDFGQVAEIGNISLIKKLVEQGCGITFLYEEAVRKELEAGLLKQIIIPDCNITRDITFVWRKNSIFKEDYLEAFESFGKQKTQHFDR